MPSSPVCRSAYSMYRDRRNKRAMTKNRMEKLPMNQRPPDWRNRQTKGHVPNFFYPHFSLLQETEHV